MFGIRLQSLSVRWDERLFRVMGAWVVLVFMDVVSPGLACDDDAMFPDVKSTNVDVVWIHEMLTTPAGIDLVLAKPVLR